MFDLVDALRVLGCDDVEEMVGQGVVVGACVAVGGGGGGCAAVGGGSGSGGSGRRSRR